MKFKCGKNFIHGELILKGKECVIIFQENNGRSYVFCTKKGYCFVGTKKECIRLYNKEKKK